MYDVHIHVTACIIYRYRSDSEEQSKSAQWTFLFLFFFLINFIGIENNLANWWHQCWTQEIWVQPVMVHDWQVRGQNCKWRISLLRTAHFLKRSTLPNLPPNISVLHSNGQLPNFLTFPPFFFCPIRNEKYSANATTAVFCFFFLNFLLHFVFFLITFSLSFVNYIEHCSIAVNINVMENEKAGLTTQASCKFIPLVAHTMS